MERNANSRHTRPGIVPPALLYYNRASNNHKGREHMDTKAVRLYGKRDLRLETFALPPLKDDEILVRIVSDSLCMSSYKAAEQGETHKRVPGGIAENPVIIGHEFCGEIVEAGKKWADEWSAGEKFSIQPAINYKGSPAAVGYSYEFIGGCMTYAIVPNEYIEEGCLLHYGGEAFFYGSLAEPMSCIAGAFHASYHTSAGSYTHRMGIVNGGRMAILAGAGPMGLGAADYALHGGRKPSVLVITDIDNARLSRAAELITVEEAARVGVRLHYVNTKNIGDAAEYLTDLAGGGFDDVFVFAPVAGVVELGDGILGQDGCLNFFAGPTDRAFAAKLNFYNVHYNASHIAGTSGGNTDDMIESLRLMESGAINPAAMITHIGGLGSAASATLNLPGIPGGKKLIYTHIDLPLTAIDDMKDHEDPALRRAHEIVKRHGGLWCAEAEAFLLGAKKQEA